MTKYPKGSEWRIWDLHIHTPGTAKNDQYGNDEAVWEEYITKLEENTDVAVLGITDYFSIENYLFLKQKQAEGRLQGPLRRGGMDVAHEVRQIPRLSSDFFCSEVNDESKVSAGYWVLSPWLFLFSIRKRLPPFKMAICILHF